MEQLNSRAGGAVLASEANQAPATYSARGEPWSWAHLGEMLQSAPSRNGRGLPFALAAFDAEQDRELGPLSFECDFIGVATQHHTAAFDIQGKDEVRPTPILPGTVCYFPRGTEIRSLRLSTGAEWLGLCTDLDELAALAGWGPVHEPLKGWYLGRVDPLLLRIMKVLAQEARDGFPSGKHLLEAACLTVVARYRVSLFSAPGREGSNIAEQHRPSRRLQSWLKQAKTWEMLAPTRAVGMIPPRSLNLESLQRAAFQRVAVGLDVERRPVGRAGALEKLVKPGDESPTSLFAASRASNERKVGASMVAPAIAKASAALGASPATIRVWTGPPVEPATLWLQRAHEGEDPEALAVVYWTHDCDVSLRQGEMQTRYKAIAGSVDIVSSMAVYDGSVGGCVRSDVWTRHARVIPLESSRFALVGVAPRQTAPVLQITDLGFKRVLSLYLAAWESSKAPQMLQGKAVAALWVGMVASRIHAVPLELNANALSDAHRELVWQMVTSHLGSLSAADLIARLPFSRQSLADAFKAAFGTTLRQFTLDRMIDASRWALAKTEMPLTDIAMEVGFASPSHFSTTFNARVGCTPRAYRSAFRGDLDAPPSAS